MTSNALHPWQKLLRNKAAVCGMIVIAACVIVAVFAYYISPDNSPDANRIIVEIGGQKPGFQQQFLKLPRQYQPPSQSFFDVLVNGKKDRFDFIPITNYSWTNDSLVINKYVDEGVTERISYSKSSVAGARFRTMHFILGTDKFGRDILSRLIVGVRVSLGVGLVYCATVFGDRSFSRCDRGIFQRKGRRCDHVADQCGVEHPHVIACVCGDACVRERILAGVCSDRADYMGECCAFDQGAGARHT